VRVVQHLCESAKQGGQLQQVLRAGNNNGAPALITAASFPQPEVLEALLQYHKYGDMASQQVMSKAGGGLAASHRQLLFSDCAASTDAWWWWRCVVHRLHRASHPRGPWPAGPHSPRQTTLHCGPLERVN
jgi:hypothetical protein